MKSVVNDIQNFLTFSIEFQKNIFVKDGQLWEIPKIPRIITLGDNSIKGGPSITNTCKDIVHYTRERFGIGEILYMDSTGTWTWYDGGYCWYDMPFWQHRPATESFVKRSWLHVNFLKTQERVVG